jgi:hypothetical protein
MTREPSRPCQSDLACYRQDGHTGNHAYPTDDTVPEPVAFLSSTLGPGPDYTDLLLLIADCLVTLAWKAEPDAGARRSRLDALHAALGSERTGRG